MLALQRQHAGRIRGYVTVNPNYPTEALEEIARCLDAGMIGIKLAASRRANDPLVDPICRAAAERRVPVLHHVWQSRRGEYAGQEASDAWELGELARAAPAVVFLLAHIGGGGDWLQSLPAIRGLSNVMVDLSGSGVDGGMLEACIEAVGVQRLLWGCDLTIETGWAKLATPRASPVDRRAGAGPLGQRRAHLSVRRVPLRLMRIDVNAFLGAYPFRRVPGTSPESLIARDGSAGDRRGLGDPSARRFLARSRRGQLLAARDRARQPRLRPVPAAASRYRRLARRARVGTCWPARRRSAPTPPSTASTRRAG